MARNTPSPDACYERWTAAARTWKSPPYVTNLLSNLQELRALVEAAVGTGWKMVQSSAQHFNIEGGAALLSAFESVMRVDCPPSHLVVTDIKTLTDYVASVAAPYEAQVDVPWSEVVNRVNELASAARLRDGEVQLSTGVGAFVCR